MSLDTVEEMIEHACQLHEVQRDLEAISWCERILAVEPEHARTQFLKATVHLAHGEYAEGFRLFESRMRYEPGNGYRYLDVPQWDGRPTNKRVLIWSDEGLGDCIQMIRFMPLVRWAGKITLQIYECMARLCEYNEVCRIIVPVLGEDIINKTTEMPECDLQCSLASLPYVLGIGLENIQGSPYLNAPPNPALKAHWEHPNRARIGLCWTGNGINKRNKVRSIDPELMKLMFTGFNCISLMHEDTRVRDVANLAELIDQLDLVITVDTLHAHLAGAMGKDCWLLLPVDCDWRWMQWRTDTPWYDSVRLFRQKEPGNWAEVLNRVTDALHRREADILAVA